jgi:hypothetical protein
MGIEAVMKLAIPFSPALVDRALSVLLSAPAGRRVLLWALMLDLVSILSTVAMFALACLYVRGCERLKGTRS